MIKIWNLPCSWKPLLLDRIDARLGVDLLIEFLGVNHPQMLFWDALRPFLCKWTMVEVPSRLNVLKTAKRNLQGKLPWKLWNFGDLVHQLPMHIYSWNLVEEELSYGSMSIPNSVLFQSRFNVQSNFQSSWFKLKNPCLSRKFW